MAKYSENSKKILETCDIRLQELFYEVIKNRDCTIICGYRGESAQRDANNNGLSKVQFPNSKHNLMPSMAVDVISYPIDWNDYGRCYMFVGYVMAVADRLGVKIRCGADWDGDGKTKDQTLNDLVHFELIE